MCSGNIFTKSEHIAGREKSHHEPISSGFFDSNTISSTLF